jgi:hypothetical protein
LNSGLIDFQYLLVTLNIFCQKNKVEEEGGGRVGEDSTKEVFEKKVFAKRTSD